MNKLTKKQLLIGALILLFAINLAALGTIIYQNYQNNQIPQEVNRFQPGERHVPSGRGVPGRSTPGRRMGTKDPAERQDSGRPFNQLVRERLELDEQQFSQYQELMKKNREEQRNIAMVLAEKRNQMMEELAKDEPNQQKLDDLAREIGDLHTELKRNTIDHFNQFRSICRPEQRKALNQMILDMSHHKPHQPGHNRPPGGRGMNRN